MSNNNHPESGKGVSVLVCQRGSRHRYAIPRLLHEEKMLAGLYTDSSVHSLMGWLAVRMEDIRFPIKKIHALRERIPAGIPKDRIYSTDRLLYAAIFSRHPYPELSSAYIRKGLRGADILYSMYGEEIGFVEWAKGQGCFIAVDVFVHPDTIRIVGEESMHYQEACQSVPRLIENIMVHSRQTFEVADILLCPSEWVASGIRDMFPEFTDKIRIVPYGSSVVPATKINLKPDPGRIIFAGRDALRKGLHYLADAARQIRERGYAIDVRVAGIEAEQLSWIPYVEELNCLGKIPMDSMRDEFMQADVFVLPSLSEGQAGVLLEAMACGCPVIATRESGVDFVDGCGITVPSRESAALADAICGVIADREKRNALAEGALLQSREYTMEAWKRRLVKAMKDVAVAG